MSLTKRNARGRYTMRSNTSSATGNLSERLYSSSRIGFHRTGDLPDNDLRVFKRVRRERIGKLIRNFRRETHGGVPARPGEGWIVGQMLQLRQRICSPG